MKTERNQGAPWATATKRRAHLLNKRGYDAKEIVGHLKDEGLNVPYSTVKMWIGKGKGAAA